MSLQKPRATVSNAFIYDGGEAKRLHKKWHQDDEGAFLHFCGKLSPEKTLTGRLDPDTKDCTCCGTHAPEQVLMLQKLQQLNATPDN
jgi:hypothetical protein